MGTKDRIDPRRHGKLTFDSSRWPALTILFLLPLLALAAASCVGRKDEPVFVLGNEDVTLEGEATLTCSEQCRGSSQCGTLGNSWVILASSSGPATEFHDLTFPADSQVTIIGTQMEVVQSINDPSKDQRMAFYAVEVPDLGAGWVAGWCIGQLIVP